MVDAEKLLRDVLKTIAKEQNYNGEVTVNLASSGNANYTTKLYVATLSAPVKADLKLFGKVAVFSKELREKVLAKYYVTENLFFTNIVKRYESIQNKHHITGGNRLVFPKLYGCNSKYLEETVVFEDLGAKGFVSYDRFKSIDWEYASKTVEEMAKFHALSIAYGQEYPGEYQKLLSENLQFEIPAERESFRKICGGWFKAALEVTKEEYRERFKRFMEKYGDMEATTQFYSPLRCAAVVHGDFKITNLMHKIRDDGKLKVAILDYQTLHAGSPAADLVYFIFTGSDQEFRRRHYRQLVDHYYTQLRAALARLGVDDRLYSREDFDFEMETVLPLGLTVAVYVLLVLLVRDEDAPAVDSGLDLDAFSMRPSAVYGRRLNEILEDYAEWGIL